MSYKYLESCLINVMSNCACYGDVSALLGNSILENKDIEYILTEKFLFLRILNKDTSIQNLIGYLCDSPLRRDAFYYKV